MKDRKSELHALDLSHVTWRKASASAGEHECVEIAELPGGGRAVRDSKNPERGALRFGAPGWAAFQASLVAGRL
ncbi:DUF397 domain-containing protein [Streptomyces sp. S07_1.15]|uniref:DUF397 domain-containing protein n=1 Tax=Streptomyces sp. S07_1.15 TaxID=2873925 RepID=UPI001D15598D|nr:DUF397 domain-containing protein [Streptomyces sp. S07_1.15]MCC3654857.1 DUF397 domain-containing protein [Streptomyces sp. S07_1.15]